MIDFQPDTFFDLEGFSHPEILDPDKPVWAALGKHLADYLESSTYRSINDDQQTGVHQNGDRIDIAPGCAIEPGAVIV